MHRCLTTSIEEITDSFERGMLFGRENGPDTVTAPLALRYLPRIDPAWLEADWQCYTPKPEVPKPAEHKSVTGSSVAVGPAPLVESKRAIVAEEAGPHCAAAVYRRKSKEYTLLPPQYGVSRFPPPHVDTNSLFYHCFDSSRLQRPPVLRYENSKLYVRAGYDADGKNFAFWDKAVYTVVKAKNVNDIMKAGLKLLGEASKAPPGAGDVKDPAPFEAKLAAGALYVLCDVGMLCDVL